MAGKSCQSKDDPRHNLRHGEFGAVRAVMRLVRRDSRCSCLRRLQRVLM